MGLVNSGMFNQLTLNLDVPAIHFIAANNVGKTSLIEAVQFLYFHSLKEMTFSKSPAETLPFYFRPEGSYLLFEVRTLAQTVRTICVYGEGSADTRRIYLFDGSFDLSTFMDDEQKPLRPEAVQPALFARRFTRFATFEEYERALIGQHADDRLNVQLFDLSLTNLYRKS